MAARFRDRADAGRRLAGEFALPFPQSAVVLGLPRGGVPVGFEVARRLGAELDVVVVRKVGVPWHPELAMGAVAEDGISVIDETIVRGAGVSAAELARVTGLERDEVTRRLRLFRGGRAPVALTGRTAIVVDDGVATGATARVACRVARHRGAGRVVIAIPVAAADALEILRLDADDVVCVRAVPSARFGSVSRFYLNFRPTSEEEVVALLAVASSMHTSSGTGEG